MAHRRFGEIVAVQSKIKKNELSGPVVMRESICQDDLEVSANVVLIAGP